jgi:hypothetical protein
MANTMKTNTAEKPSILGRLLRPALPFDTDGLPGLQDAPVVYDLILRDLRGDEGEGEGEGDVVASPRDNQDPVLREGQRPR